MDQTDIETAIRKLPQLKSSHWKIAIAVEHGCHSIKAIMAATGYGYETVKDYLSEIYAAVGIENLLQLSIVMCWNKFLRKPAAVKQSGKPLKSLLALPDLAVVALIAEGHTIVRIAAVFTVTRDVLNNWLSRINRKAGCSDRFELAESALRERFLALHSAEQ
jgi:DNA-binding NarL/FixJ family response regulator